MYKSKLKAGTTFFGDFKVSWANATQEELKKVYDLGHTKLVTTVKDAEPTKIKTKAKTKAKSSKSNSTKE